MSIDSVCFLFQLATTPLPTFECRVCDMPIVRIKTTEKFENIPQSV